MAHNDEKFCKSRFDAFLERFSATSSRKWRKGPKNRPPDYYLFLDAVSYAVEVTILMEEAKHALRAWLRKFVSGVEIIAEQRGGPARHISCQVSSAD